MVRWIRGTWCIVAVACASAPAEPPPTILTPESFASGEPASDREEPPRPADDARARIASARAALEAGGELGQGAVEAANALAELPIEDAREREELSAVLLRALGPVPRPEPLESHVAAAIVRALGVLASASAVPRLVEALVQCEHSYVPEEAVRALVRIGRPALEPLLSMLRGEHERARAVVDGCAELLAQTRGADAPRGEDSVAMQAAQVLGQLGFAEATDPLLVEARHTRGDRRAVAAQALAGMPRDATSDRRIRDAIIAVYRRTREPTFEERAGAEAMLLFAFHRRGDREVLTFLRTEGVRVVRDPALEGDASLRPLFALGVALALADESDVPALRALVDRPATAWGRGEGSDDAYAVEARAVFDAIDRCGRQLACWRGAIADPDPRVVRKALMMTARYGRGDAESIAAIAQALAHESDEVRVEAYWALDLAAPAGDAAAVVAIDAQEARERAYDLSMHELNRTTRSRLTHRSTDDPEAAPRLARGRALYRTTCTTCHAEDGSPVATGTPTPSRSLANLGRDEAAMHRNLEAIGRRFRHPTASAEEWQLLGLFLRQLGTLE